MVCDADTLFHLNRKTLPLFVILCALLWGSAFPGIKYVYAQWNGADTFSVRLVFAGVRFALAGLLLLPFSRRPFLRLPEGSLGPLAAIALTQTFGQYLFFYTGLSVSSGVLASLLVSTGSLWWVVLAPLMLGTPKPGYRQWLLLGLSSLGITIAVYKPGAGAGDPVLGAILFLAASLCGALAIILFRRLDAAIDPVKATAVALFSGGVLLMIVGAAGWSGFLALLDIRTALMTVYLAAVSATAFCLWNQLAQLFPVNLLAGYRFLIPLAGAVMSALLVPGESIGIGALTGGAMILTALILLNHSHREK